MSNAARPYRLPQPVTALLARAPSTNPIVAPRIPGFPALPRAVPSRKLQVKHRQNVQAMASMTTMPAAMPLRMAIAHVMTAAAVTTM